MSGRRDPIPDVWPPDPAPPSPGRIVPLFPLPNLFLFPGTAIPMQVFEPRYLQLVEDSLDGPGRLVLGTVLEGHHDELDGAPPVHHIAGLGEIARHEKLPDGRYLVVVVGLVRVLIREVPSERLYRRVEAIPLREVPASAAEEPRLRERLHRAVMERAEIEDLPADLPLGRLADYLLLNLELPQAQMQEIFSRREVAVRARRALAEHKRQRKD